jgi:hypothetical protein
MLTLRFVTTTIITGVIFLCACTKSDQPSESKQRLKKIINRDQGSDSAGYRNFNYDSQGNIISIEDSNSQTHMWRTFISYNNQNNMVKAIRLHYYGALNNVLSQRTDSFVYDNSNRIIKKLTLSGNGSYQINNTYNYDGQNRLLVDSMYFSSGGPSAYFKFSYNGNDNVILFEKFENSSGTIQKTINTKASYSLKNNPFYASTSLLYFLFYSEDFQLLSKNAPLQIVYRLGYTTDYSYEYFDNGLHKKLTEKYNEPNDPTPSISTTEFFYE